MKAKDIRSIRAKLRETQAKFAERLGAAKIMVTQWECGNMAHYKALLERIEGGR